MLLSWCSDPNGHIFVDATSIPRRTSTWKVRQNSIDFERQIHVETVTSIRRGNFNVDSNFKINKISMSFPRGFFISFRCQFDVTALLAVSFLSFWNNFYSGNLF